MLLIEDGVLVHADTSDVLEHYGVKGMKWGKRRAKLKDKIAQHEKVLSGDNAAVTTRLAKRAAVGYLVGNVPGSVLGAATYRGGAKRGIRKAKKQLAKLDYKEKKQKLLDRDYEKVSKEHNAYKTGVKKLKSELKSGKITKSDYKSKVGKMDDKLRKSEERYDAKADKEYEKLKNDYKRKKASIY